MYVLVEDNQYIVVGPVDWNQKSLQWHVDDLDLDIDINIIPAQYTNPIIINEQYKIIECDDIIIPDHNPKIQQLAGPFWDFTDPAKITGSYTVVDQDITSVKAKIIAELASARYVKENAGADYEFNGSTIKLDTSREFRNILAQKYLVMTDNITDTVKWKFNNNNWLDLTKADLLAIGQAVNVVVQAAYDWEHDQLVIINNAVSLNVLNDIDYRNITNPNPIG